MYFGFSYLAERLDDLLIVSASRIGAPGFLDNRWHRVMFIFSVVCIFSSITFPAQVRDCPVGRSTVSYCNHFTLQNVQKKKLFYAIIKLADEMGVKMRGNKNEME
ncbi:hypothetical protein LAZ67_1007745 [Cordylochernes scorpioides]|uniref:Uncharacterized protein n=1 Tax=Cordylochernes scorpioides TaxID=51811 RepID=A0ABY6K191_9ARAC|nr:hypothetical protein LAZ67_1007745 [Cordylochernes scorpioides]